MLKSEQTLPGSNILLLMSGSIACAKASTLISEWTKRGHKVRFVTGPYGGYQAIHYDIKRDLYIAASESRKDGHAAGY